LSKKIIFGPPGTGKTTRLLSIVEEELARGVPPDRIAYLAFTRKAAQEAVERAGNKFNLTKKELIWFRTIHSFVFKIMNIFVSMIYPERGELH
jgi:DNA helicase-2/ATP-dependent DNA helicase PcrA